MLILVRREEIGGKGELWTRKVTAVWTGGPSDGQEDADMYVGKVFSRKTSRI